MHVWHSLHTIRLVLFGWLQMKHFRVPFFVFRIMRSHGG
jgi:hypothetical protein